jgi:signal transduction histidine kinase
VRRGVARLAWLQRLPLPLIGALFFLAFLSLAQISYLFVFPREESAVFWLPSGLSLVLLLRTSPRRWPVWLCAIFFASLAVVRLQGQPLPLAAAWGLADCLLPLSGTLLLRRFAPAAFRLCRDLDVIWFVLLGAVAGPIPGVLVAALAGVYWLERASFLAMASSWWISDAVGVLLLGPFLLAWTTPAPRPAGRATEALVLLAVLVGVAWWSFWSEAPGFHVSLSYLLLPLAAWSALRFGTRGATLATLLLDFLAVWLTVRGLGPLAILGESVAVLVLNVQLYISVVSLFALLVAVAVAQMQEAIRARDEFISVASHELNTPIAALSLMVQRLQRRGAASAEALSQALARIELQTRRLTHLVHELLSFSRISAGRLELQLQAVDLTAIVREVVERSAEELSQAGCQLSLHVGGPVIGRWDLVRLEQVTSNLLSNAIKFGAGKPIEIAVREASGVASLVVSDQGIGIPPARQPYIFERFERAVSARSYSGLGLGLYIVRSIVEALGGSIRVESEPGQGSVFTVELPCTGPPRGVALKEVGSPHPIPAERASSGEPALI